MWSRCGHQTVNLCLSKSIHVPVQTDCSHCREDKSWDRRGEINHTCCSEKKLSCGRSTWKCATSAKRMCGTPNICTQNMEADKCIARCKNVLQQLTYGIYMCVCVCVNIYMCICIYVCIYMCVCLCVCVHIYTHTHTQTHTHTNAHITLVERRSILYNECVNL